MENTHHDHNKDAVQCHEKAAHHHELAAKCLHKAAEHGKAGKHVEAAAEAYKAHGHAHIAEKHSAEAAKTCAGTECKEAK